MNPRFFAEPALFGIHHGPTDLVAGDRIPILVCPPIGHEHTRAQRALKVLSQALARAGHHVLRFDYRGLGDSWGGPADGGVKEWCEDIAHGLEELAALSGTRTVSVVGLRLGAALAVQALADGWASDLDVQTLVLWDPVLCGDDFLRVALSFQSSFLNDPGRFPALACSARGVPRREPGDDLLGYCYPAALRRSLGTLDLRSLDPWPSVPTAIMSSEPSRDCEALVSRLRARGARARCRVVDGAEGAWDDYARHETTLRAGRIIPAIVAQLAETVT